MILACRNKLLLIIALSISCSFTGCVNIKSNITENNKIIELKTQNIRNEDEIIRLKYHGKASIRIITAEEKVIYIDPYAGTGYDKPADLILVTHDHFNHSAIDKVEELNDDFNIDIAEKFEVNNRVIIENGQEIILKKSND